LLPLLSKQGHHMSYSNEAFSSFSGAWQSSWLSKAREQPYDPTTCSVHSAARGRVHGYPKHTSSRMTLRHVRMQPSV
jgi:hypothetical protein